VELGQYRAALDAFDRAQSFYASRPAAMHPDRADALVGRGRAHLGLGEIAPAVQALEAADGFWRGFDARNRYAADAASWLARARSR
jgi:tetratricopeptide (TPR) repeat protein